MTSFVEHFNKSFRLALLRLLAEAPAYSANAAVLQSTAGLIGFNVSRDQVLTQLDWLKEQGLVQLEDFGNVRVASLTTRGFDVQTGVIMATGVDRPTPKG